MPLYYCGKDGCKGHPEELMKCGPRGDEQVRQPSTFPSLAIPRGVPGLPEKPQSSDTQTNSDIRSDEGLVQQLIEELKVTAGLDACRSEIAASSNAVLRVLSDQEACSPVEDNRLPLPLQDYAARYLCELGFEVGGQDWAWDIVLCWLDRLKEDPWWLDRQEETDIAWRGHRFSSPLELVEAIFRRGDLLGALNVLHQAYQANARVLKRDALLSRIQQQNPEIQQRVYEGWGELLGWKH
jgi:hypothetical protein